MLTRSLSGIKKKGEGEREREREREREVRVVSGKVVLLAYKFLPFKVTWTGDRN